MKQVLIISILFFAFFLKGEAQSVFPPKPECVTNLIQNGGDIQLTWQLPDNSGCGAFSYYLIYESPNGKGGPYTKIDTVFNPAQTLDTIIGAKGLSNTWNFYIVTVCGGITSVSSDTVDNQDPVPPVINYVTVVGSDSALLNWQPGASPQTFQYIIYKVVNGNNIPIDTTPPGRFNTSFTDPLANTSGDTASYVIAALDSCGHTGPISATPHRTIFLSVSAVTCQPTGTASWLPYEGWAVDHYKVYISLNGKPPVLLTTTSATTASFNYTSDSICLTVVGFSAGNIDSSTSNKVCVQGNSSNPITDFYIRNVTVAGTEVNNILYSVAPKSGVLYIKLERVNTPGDVPAQTQINTPVNNLLNAINNTADSAADNQSQSYYYRLIATDSCGRADTSSMGKSILLSGYAFTNLKNSLTWDDAYLQYGTILEYRLFREPNLLFPIAVLSPGGTNSYQEDVSRLVGDTGNLCYVVVAKIATSFPNGKMDTVNSFSNVVCLDQIIQVTVPNAFNPDGINKIFKPVLRFTGDKSYSFEVYNRWGGLIFSTKNFSEGWDGKYNGKLVEQGVYAYDIQIIDKEGRNTEKKGTVMVLR